MSWQEDLLEAKTLFEQAQALLTKEGRSQEDANNATRAFEDGRALKTRAMNLREIQQAIAEIPGLIAAPTHSKSAFRSLREFWVAVSRAGDVRIRNEALHPGLKRQAKLGTDAATGEAEEDTWTAGDNIISREFKATMVESVGARGGFLVPDEFLAELMAITAERTFVRARATIIPMRRRLVKVPVLDQTSTTAGRPHWFGGILANWTEEGAQKHQDDPEFREINLVAHKLVCYTRASDELLEDAAISLDAFLRSEMGFAGAIAWEEEYCFIQGTGVGQPLGVIPANATITVNRTADAIVVADLAEMLENFLPGANGVWVISQSCFSSLLQLNGPPGNPSYVFIPNARDGVPGTLFGLPIYWTEKCPQHGTTGDIILADWKYYLIGDRQATTIASTNIERFRNDETSWRAVHRVDGQPWLSQPLTLQDGIARVSPFVILGAKPS